MAILGSQSRRGVWHIGPQHVAFAVLGDFGHGRDRVAADLADVKVVRRPPPGSDEDRCYRRLPKK